MAKTIEEIIDVMGFTLNDDRDSQKAVISEIYYGFNQPESKIVFSGLIKDIPEELKNTRYTQACFDLKQIPTKLNIQIMHLLKVKNYFNS